ncbi:MAG: tRNA (5-methylaminomethyl-2-thiouridylate)-methyltransferase, partial [Gammaproteobacteria bacterium]|nr:tRNA (5-methylaminomethyl-2-thiouridylate)-methyltransferase [Gammaproteobacteria bacterium]
GFMVKKANEWMHEHDFDFIITGEVVGQRPMSQRRDTMPIVAKESGSGDRLVRPLSAKVLPETLPELEGWLDRDKLFGFTGRTRKPQMALAKEYGFSDYASPAGGCCMLTDENYSKKLVDMWQNRQDRDYELDDIMLLKVGRHIRFSPDFKLIIGREEGENNFLQGYQHLFNKVYCTSHSGPLAMIDGVINSDQDREKALAIIARYSQGKNADSVTMAIETPDKQITEYNIKPIAQDDIDSKWMI